MVIWWAALGSTQLALLWRSIIKTRGLVALPPFDNNETNNNYNYKKKTELNQSRPNPNNSEQLWKWYDYWCRVHATSAPLMSTTDGHLALCNSIMIYLRSATSSFSFSFFTHRNERFSTRLSTLTSFRSLSVVYESLSDSIRRGTLSLFIQRLFHRF